MRHASQRKSKGVIAPKMAAEARDPKKREILWRDTVKYTGLKETDTILANWA
jgi:succinate dehydrogenase flavin-adding protein (antitoxin of CptAB toxin-antitoxin module)